MKSLKANSKFITKIQKKQFAAKKIDYNLKEFDVIAIGGLNAGGVLKWLQHTDFHGTMAGFSHKPKFFNENQYGNLFAGSMKPYKYICTNFGNMYNTEQSVFSAHTIVDIKPELNQVIDDKGTAYTYKTLLLDTGLKQVVENMPFLEKFVNDSEFGESRVFVSAPSDEFHVERNKRLFNMHKDNDFLVYLPEYPNRREAYDNLYLALELFISQGQLSCGRSKDIKVRVITPNNYLFRFPFANEVVLDELSQRTSIELHFGYSLTNVEIEHKPNATMRYATFKSKSGEEMRIPFGTLHVTPENKKRQLFENNDVADEHGQVKVNPHTLQHEKYQNIFAFGDAINVDTTKSMYAALNQSTVVRNNLKDYLYGKEFRALYKGYSAFSVDFQIGRCFTFSHYYNYVPAMMNFWVPRFLGFFAYSFKGSLEGQYLSKIYQSKLNYSYPYIMKEKHFRPLDENSYMKKMNIKREEIFIHSNSAPHLSHAAHH